jgi:hypothetical protein
VSRYGHFVTFLSDRDGDTDVWVTQVGSGEFHNLTHGSAPGLAAGLSWYLVEVRRRPSAISVQRDSSQYALAHPSIVSGKLPSSQRNAISLIRSWARPT